jgi:hypothetical protein
VNLLHASHSLMATYHISIMFIDICNIYIYIIYNIHVSYLHRYQSSTHVCLRKVRLTCQALPGTSNFELCTRGQLEDLDQEIH